MRIEENTWDTLGTINSPWLLHNLNLKKKKELQEKLQPPETPILFMVPGTRIELVQPYGRGILSPLRLPVPPPGHGALS